MSILNNLKRQNDVENPSDVLGGFSVLDSGVYPVTVKQAFLKPAQSGALGIEVHLQLEDRVHTEWLFVTNKSGDNFYIRNNVKHYLPSFITVDELCYLTTEKHLSDQETEDKLVKLFNYETKSEKPTEVPVLVNLIGKSILVGLLHEKDFKQVKTDNGYESSEDIIEKNVINKFFAEDGRTYNEIIADSDPDFIESWKEKYEGNIRDLTKNKKPTVSSSKAKEGTPKKSLFGDKK